MLPNSTERAVTISGNSEAITQCIYNICNIMAEVGEIFVFYVRVSHVCKINLTRLANVADYFSLPTRKSA